MIRESETRAFPVNEATEANEHYAGLLFALMRTMLEDCNRGRGTSGIREAAELLRPALAELEKERGRMVHDHLRYNDSMTHARLTMFGNLARPGMLDEEVSGRAAREREVSERLAAELSNMPPGESLRIDEA